MARDDAPPSNNQLGDFLRAHRSRISPHDVGLPSVAGRRVVGLQREEVAVFSGVSADYYARLEQGRECSPSAQVVDAICHALRLASDAREHAFRLAKLSATATLHHGWDDCTASAKATPPSTVESRNEALLPNNATALPTAAVT